MSHTLPVRVVLDMLCSILDAQREQLRRRQARSPNPGRAKQIDLLSEQIRLCGPMLQDKRLGQVAEVDPIAAALLCAWASGHMPALGMLEQRLAEIKHPAAGRITGLHPWRWAEGFRLMVLPAGE
jgi:hypothetical protein